MVFRVFSPKCDEAPSNHGLAGAAFDTAEIFSKMVKGLPIPILYMGVSIVMGDPQ